MSLILWYELWPVLLYLASSHMTVVRQAGRPKIGFDILKFNLSAVGFPTKMNTAA